MLSSMHVKSATCNINNRPHKKTGGLVYLVKKTASEDSGVIFTTCVYLSVNTHAASVYVPT